MTTGGQMHPHPILTAASALLLLGAPAQASDLLSSGDSPMQQFGRYFLNVPNEVKGLQVDGNDWQEVNLTFRFTLTAPLKVSKLSPKLRRLSTLEAWQYVSITSCAKYVNSKSLVSLEKTVNSMVGRLIVRNGRNYCAKVWNIS
jgi:hypothetical protein